jgi:hypothetical protein
VHGMGFDSYYIILYKTLNNAAKHWARIIVHTIDILP